MATTIVFLFAFLATALGFPTSSVIEENSNNPYSVSIQKGLITFEHTCGGAILSPNWIITAGHCIGFDLLISRVVAGILNLNDTNTSHMQIRTIDLYNIVLHPEFDAITNDIALIKVNEPFTFDDYVQPLKISKVSCVANDEINTFSGWFDNGNPSQTSLQIMPFEDCYTIIQSIYGDNLHLQSEIHICVTGSSSVCLSDGGGPLVQDNRLIGVLSWLSGNCLDDTIPAIFTNSGQFKDFIKEHVDDLP